MPRDEALADLRELPGIGGFSAELVLMRGAGSPDVVPLQEPRLARAVATEYGLPSSASADDLVRIADGWRPYRSWVALLLRVRQEDEAAEIGGPGRGR